MIRQLTLYREDLENVVHLKLPWEMLRNRKILLTGARGMIGSFLIDALMLRNELYGDNILVYALGRNEWLARQRFNNYLEQGGVILIRHDINHALPSLEQDVDYIIHAASNTHPIAYSTDPISTMTTNIFGVYNLLNFAVEKSIRRFMFVSSVEIYGENRGDKDQFDESYCGYIDCNTLRAGYPESKRAAEALCNAFMHAFDIGMVITRLSRVYGPTMLAEDSKAISQFIKNGVAGRDVVLKSEGNQHYSYCYVADAVSGILTVLLNGKSGEAYNISGLDSDVTLRSLAETIADVGGAEVIFEIPSEKESVGYSKATKALLDISKAKRLGWEPRTTMEEGLLRTIEILRLLGLQEVMY